MAKDENKGEQKNSLLQLEPKRLFLFTATIYFLCQILLLFVNYQTNVNQTFYTVSFAFISLALICLYISMTDEKMSLNLIHLILICTVISPLIISSLVKVSSNVNLLTLDFILILLLGLHSNGLTNRSFLLYNILGVFSLAFPIIFSIEYMEGLQSVSAISQLVFAIFFAFMLLIIHILIQKNLKYYSWEGNPLVHKIELIVKAFSIVSSKNKNIKDTVNLVISEVIPMLDLEECKIYLHDADKNTYVKAASFSKSSPNSQHTDPEELLPGEGIVGSVAQSGITEIIPNTSMDKRYITGSKNGMSEICVPIIHENRVLGIIDSEHSKKGFFNQTHKYIINLIANLIASRLVYLENINKIKSQDSLELEAKHLQELDQIKSQFISNVSHDLKTPLTLILGPALNLMNGESEKPKEDASVIYKNAKDLKKILDQLIELNNSNFIGQHIKIVETDIVELIQQWTNKYKQWASKKQIHLSLHGPEYLELSFDETKLHSIVSNLVDNAIKYTPSNGEVRIEYMLHDETFQLIVEDSGIGIKDSQKEKIFERFYRIGSADAKGTGIGLSIVREYVEQMGGKIEVKTSELGGTRFCINFNIKFLKGDVPSSAGTIKSSEPLPKSDVKPQVMIVEDHDDLRNFLVSSLNKKYECIPAMNGKIAFELAKKNAPDLIITDLMMPEMSGEELAGSIRDTDHLSHIPILVLSAKSRTLDKVELYKIGADNYLQKPFDMEELQVIVSNLLEQRKRLREAFKSEVFESQEQPIEVNEYLEDSFMIDLVEVLEKNLSNSAFSIVDLCQELSVGRNQLQKKVKAMTNMTPVEFVRSFRIKKAYTLLKQGELTVSEVAYKVGFNNLSYFTRMFKKQFGVLPSSISSKYEIQT